MSEINTKDANDSFSHAIATAVMSSVHACTQNYQQFLNIQSVAHQQDIPPLFPVHCQAM